MSTGQFECFKFRESSSLNLLTDPVGALEFKSLVNLVSELSLPGKLHRKSLIALGRSAFELHTMKDHSKKAPKLSSFTIQPHWSRSADLPCAFPD